jgi:ATP-binding cassette, subfamily B, bacterial
MQSPLPLPPRRYSVIDSIGIVFRCAPFAAFFYGFFDLASAALTPVTTLVAARLIDAVVRTVSEGAPVQEVYVQLALLTGLTAFHWLRSPMHQIADLRLTLALRARYRTALTEKRTRLEYGLLEQSGVWDLIQRVAANPEGGRLKVTYYHLIKMLAFIIKVGGLLVILASAVWWAPLVVIVVAGFALASGVRGGKVLYHAEREVAAHDRRIVYLNEVMLGRDASAERILFGASSMLTDKWHSAFTSALNVRFRARIKWYLNAYAGNITNLLIWIGLMLLLLPPLQAGTVSVGLFIALTQAFTKFDIVWGFMDTVNGLTADAEFFKDLTAFLALKEEGKSPSGSTFAVTSAVPESKPALLELRDVRFRYPGSNRLILDGLSMVLEAGKHYALVGANGCGKTTITRLITGLYPVESGAIRVFGRDIGEYSCAELRSLFSTVYQDFARYGVSLHDNVYLGHSARPFSPDNVSKASWAAEKEVYEQAGLGLLIDLLPMGADTPLGKVLPDGIDISGGEWQRVAVARSLAQPSVLRILDEPTAALDPLAESQLYERFGQLTEGATTLLITHRLGATKTADVIMVLDGGRIVESGTHSELMQVGGLYCKMYESQRYWYEAE